MLKSLLNKLRVARRVFIYRVLMWAHGHAESLWHWCYYTSLKYKEPPDDPPMYALGRGTYSVRIERIRKPDLGILE